MLSIFACINNAAHYRIGECYKDLPKENWERSHFVKIIEIGKEKYLYSYYQPLINEWDNPGDFGLYFDMLEHWYPIKVACPK